MDEKKIEHVPYPFGEEHADLKRNGFKDSMNRAKAIEPWHIWELINEHL